MQLSYPDLIEESTAFSTGAPRAGRPGEKAERMTPEAWADLDRKMIEGQIPRLEDARRYLAEKHAIRYASITSISSLFQRHEVRLKTGRKQHRKADLEEQAAFKKCCF